MRYQLIIGTEQRLQPALRIVDRHRDRTLIDAVGSVAWLVLTSGCLSPGRVAGMGAGTLPPCAEPAGGPSCAGCASRLMGWREASVRWRIHVTRRIVGESDEPP